MKAFPDMYQKLVLDFPCCCQAIFSTHSSFRPANSACLHKLLIHRPLCCVFRHCTATPQPSVFFLYC